MGVSAEAFAQRAIELAQMKIPYVSGGKTIAGLDCSTLVWFITQELGGKWIYAGSNTIWDQHVTDKHYCDDGGSRKFGGILQPGALLYIDYANPASRTPNGTPGQMDHMGIYVGNSGHLTPDGKPANVVHASQSGGYVQFSHIPTSFIRWTHGCLAEWLDYDGPDDSGDEAPVPQNSPDEDTPAQTEPYFGEAMVAKTGVRMRRQPKIVDGKNHNRVDSIEQGTIFPILDRRNGWTQEGLTIHKGWIRDDMLTFGGED